MNHLKRTPEERAALLAHLRENYVYEPEGRIRHKARDRPRMGRNRKGDIARRKLPYPDVDFKVDGVCHDILYHQAVWIVWYGRWPVGEIDHINGNPRDNRIENLRECSGGENNLNRIYPWKPNPKTGLPGVRKDESRKTMYACNIMGKKIWFRNPYEAFYWAIICGKRYR
jgi:hypothetical protein